MTLTVPSWLEIAEKGASIAAIVIGAAWVYLNTLRGRVFKPKLAVNLQVSRESAGQTPLVRARIAVDNKGLTRVRFDQEGTGLTLRYSPAPLSTPLPVTLRFDHHAVFAVLQDHTHIEPGVTIVEELLLQVPDDASRACELRLTVVAHKTSWSCSAVLGDQNNDPRTVHH
jgi:hypothetical protein